MLKFPLPALNFLFSFAETSLMRKIATNISSQESSPYMQNDLIFGFKTLGLLTYPLGVAG
jgi:hypothetical protein